MYQIGDIIDRRYKVIEIIPGGMGIVYACIEEGTNIPVALKTLRDEDLNDSSAKKSFKREALKWINLDKHPYIVKATYYDEYQYTPYIVMELIPKDEERRNLLSHFLYVGVPYVQILEWGIQFCTGMFYAYSKGIEAHTDIKPDNIMITLEGNIKITDFGLAKSNKKVKEKNPNANFLYSDDGCGGTLQWAAPEQFDCIYNEKSDIYSFGIVLYQLISGGKTLEESLPFYADIEDVIGWKNLHKSASIKPLTHDLFPIVEKCLEKDPEQRYESFDKLKVSLEEKYQKLTGRLPPNPPKIEELNAMDLSNKGSSLFSLGLNVEAKVVLKDAIKKNKNKNFCSPHHNLALIYESEGKLDKAKEEYYKVLKYAPKHETKLIPVYARSNNNLGNILLEERECDKAIKHFKNAIRSSKNHYRAHYNLANAYYTCKKPLIFAFKKYLDAININPNYVEAYANLGVVAYDLKWFECSEKAYKKAIRIKKDYPEVYFNLGNLYWTKNKPRRAIDAYLNFIRYAGPNLTYQVKKAEKIISSIANPV